MDRWRPAALGAACLGLLGGTALVTALAGPAGASGVSVRVSPSQNLTNGQKVTVSGHGFSRTYDGKPLTWFIAECTATVQRRMNPSKDTPHCDVTEAKAIRLSRQGTFSTRFSVETGIVGDGYCGSNGHDTCIICIGNAHGQGTVVRIHFKDPEPASTTSSSSTTSTTSH